MKRPPLASQLVDAGQDQSSALRATATTPRNNMPASTRKYRFNFLSSKVGSGPFSFSDRRKDGDA